MSIGERLGITSVVLGFLAFTLLLFASELASDKSERCARIGGAVLGTFTVLTALMAIWIGAFV